MRFVRPVVQTMGNISGTIRDVKRFREVGMILAKYGLGMFASSLGVGGENSASTNPQKVVLAIQELGPTFIKFGQILSTRPDIVAKDYIDALQKLQDDIDPLDFSELEPMLKEALGAQWGSTIVRVEQKPLATASIAQVHRAVFLDTEANKEIPVVLKIQRPNIQEQIRSDLHILHILLQRGLQEYPELELFDPYGIFTEFEQSILAELDFLLESKNLLRFSKNFFHASHIRFPKVVEQCSAHNVICMEYLDGISIRKAREHGCDMELVGQRYLELAYTMLFDHGFFHGDLHPGNVLVLEKNVIGVIDCGMVGRLTYEMKDQLATLIYALYKGDNKLIAKTFYDISIKTERVDYIAFERDAIEVAEKHWSGGSFTEMDIGAFLMDLTMRAIRHKVRAPTAFTMFFKAVLTTEGLAKSLLPEVDPLRVAQPYVEKLLKTRWQPETWTDVGAQNLLAYSHILKRLPISLTQLIDDIDYQRLTLTVHQKQHDQDHKRGLQRTSVLALTLIAGMWMLLGIAAFFVPVLYWQQIPIISIFCVLLSVLIQSFVIIRVWFLLR